MRRVLRVLPLPILFDTFRPIQSDALPERLFELLEAAVDWEVPVAFVGTYVHYDKVPFMAVVQIDDPEPGVFAPAELDVTQSALEEVHLIDADAPFAAFRARDSALQLPMPVDRWLSTVCRMR